MLINESRWLLRVILCTRDTLAPLSSDKLIHSWFLQNRSCFVIIAPFFCGNSNLIKINFVAVHILIKLQQYCWQRNHDFFEICIPFTCNRECLASFFLRKCCFVNIFLLFPLNPQLTSECIIKSHWSWNSKEKKKKKIVVHIFFFA